LPGESFGEPASLRDIHVFLIVDDPESRVVLRTVLEHAGALVSVVGSARSALAALEAIRPDVLVADVSHEDTDPVAVIERVRALPWCADIPSIVVTADGSRHERQRLLACGVQAHMPRPIDASELCRLVASLAGRPG
jgi:CheY-like chemotaxis protein